MNDQELTLILKLRDEATKAMGSARKQIGVAAAAIAAAGFKAGADWDKATKTIVSGTGATGEALKGLQGDYQAVAKYGEGAATAIADLNTHLGLQGEELQMVAEAALKAKVDTNLFGDVASQLGLDAQGSTKLLDQLTVASQASGVSIDQMTKGIGKNSARWQSAGGDMDDLTALVVQASYEFGPSGLRGAISEVMEEVDKGLIPSVSDLNVIVGESTGAVEKTYKASKNWRDSVRETKDAALAAIGPYGDVLGVLGSTVTTLALAGPQMLAFIKGTKLATLAQRAFNLVMRLNPIGLIITAITLVGLAIYKWRDQIWEFLRGAWNGLIKGLEKGYNFIARLVPGMEEVEVAAKFAFAPAVDKAAVTTEDFAAALKEAELKAKPIPSLVETLSEDIKELDTSLEDQEATLIAWTLQIEDMATETVNMSDELEWLKTRFDKVKQVPIGEFLEDLGIVAEESGLQVLGLHGTYEDFREELDREVEGGFFSSVTRGFGDMIQGVTGGKGVKGMLEGIGSGITDGIGNIISGGLSALAGVALQGVVALGGKIWGGIKRLFGGESKAEKAAKAAAAQAAKDLLEAFENMVDRAYSSAISAFDQATQAGIDAYDSIMEKAIEAGATEEEALRQATDARLKATEKMLTDEGLKFARMAAFEAALEAIKSGNALSAGAAADKAARQTTQAWDAAMQAVGQASAHATKAIEQDFSAAARNINASMARITRARYDANVDDEHNQFGAFAGRQHGGPVRGGRSYIVGESGPEVFTPGRSGSVTANKRLPSAEEIGEAVARAMQGAPLVVPRDPVTDAVISATPARHALYGYSS